MRKTIHKILALALSSAMIFTTGAIAPSASAADTTDDTNVAETDTTTDSTTEDSTDTDSEKTYAYHAYLNFQTGGNWLFRGEWYDSTAGLNSKTYTYTTSSGKDKKVAFDYAKNYAKAGPGFGKYAEGGVFDANFTDVVIDHNGTYTVSVSGLDLSPAGEGLPAKDSNGGSLSEDTFNKLSVLTDITTKVPGATFSDLSISIDGKEFAKGISAFPKFDSTDSLGNTYYNLMLINKYGSTTTKDAPSWYSIDKKTIISKIKDDQKTIPAAYMPTDSISITFTVSGIDFTKDPALYTIKTEGLAKGKTFTKSGITYKVTTAAKTGTKGSVSVVGVSSKTKSSYTIPTSVSYSSAAAYNVKSIAADAFKNCKKMTKITIGSKVTSIAANAFKNCVKLSSMKISSKLSTVKKGAFTGCKKTIKVSGSNKTKNLAKLKKSGYTKFK